MSTAGQPTIRAGTADRWCEGRTLGTCGWPIISAVKVAARIGIVVVLLACAAGVAWMFTGSASDRMVGTGNVVGGVAGVLALMVAVVVLWPQITRRRAGAAAVEAGQVPAATEYLAEET